MKIGAAVGDGPLTSDSGHMTVLDREFDSVAAENAMKWDAVEPTRGSFNWAAADRLVAHASAHNQGVRGHTLAWVSLPVPGANRRRYGRDVETRGAVNSVAW
ncbi:endo-1,4-beta-xylanase [Streptomyces sp. NPDC059697]|uniref:endo-1,4-beta-xylanase n=1 Tax=Streptomyces sp. NPDC059697 TaxID=3346912 RepID=UPI00369B9907